ncbi:MAG: molecular chaperone HtpG, partial [Polyangiales bacterium]
MSMSEAASVQNHRFEAEVSQLLKLVINSLYSNKEIFLRELLSNASDALDKLRFRALTEPALLPKDSTLRIQIIPDKDKGTLTIWDNGIGMSLEELCKNLGTIAHSGSKAFLEQLQQGKGQDIELIGQFGVGFYSAYLVADHVEVVSLAAGARQAHKWASDAQESFSISDAGRVEQGSAIVLHLKADQREYLEEHRLRHLVQRYSDYLSYPIELKVQRPASDAPDAQGEEASEQEGPRFERINQGQALWQRPSSSLGDEHYAEFYKHLTHDWEPPLAHKHFKLEGTHEFTGLLFLPKRPPADLFLPESKHGVRLHVRRVFVMDDCEAVLPKWLRFFRGVLDSEDLPLNVSRETLQDSAIVRTMRKQVVKQALDLLQTLAKDRPEDYALFWQNFGAVLKEGLHFEPSTKERVLPL